MVEIMCYLVSKVKFGASNSIKNMNNTHSCLPIDLLLSKHVRCQLFSRQLHSTILKQFRYTILPCYQTLIEQLCYENNTFSTDFGELLIECISSGSVENISHIYHMIHVYLHINDSLVNQRINILFITN